MQHFLNERYTTPVALQLSYVHQTAIMVVYAREDIASCVSQLSPAKMEAEGENMIEIRAGQIIQDAAANLHPEERIEVRYLVPVADITDKGDKA